MAVGIVTSLRRMQMEGDDQPWYLKIDPTWPEYIECWHIVDLKEFQWNNPNYQIHYNSILDFGPIVIVLSTFHDRNFEKVWSIDKCWSSKYMEICIIGFEFLKFFYMHWYLLSFSILSCLCYRVATVAEWIQNWWFISNTIYTFINYKTNKTKDLHLCSLDKGKYIGTPWHDEGKYEEQQSQMYWKWHQTLASHSHPFSQSFECRVAQICMKLPDIVCFQAWQFTLTLRSVFILNIFSREMLSCTYEYVGDLALMIIYDLGIYWVIWLSVKGAFPMVIRALSQRQ